jgi:hypothetical protein
MPIIPIYTTTAILPKVLYYIMGPSGPRQVQMNASMHKVEGWVIMLEFMGIYVASC